MSPPAGTPPPAAGEPPRFPLRVASVDVGSNAIRFLAAEFSAPLEYRVLAEQREAVRLGHEVFRSGRLDPRAMDDAVAALAAFRLRMRELGIGSYRAVATSATRESRDGAALVERARREAGIELEVITGAEEARLVYEAVRAQLPLGESRWLLVDLGGGSVEVSLVDARGILSSESHTMGAVRLLEALSASGDEPGHFERLLAEYAATLRIGAVAEAWSPEGVIATGGNVEALARLAGAAPARGRPAVLPLPALRKIVRMLSALTPRERMEKLGLRADRADVILPAAMVYQRIAELAGAVEIRVPAVGLKEGVLIDLVDDLARHREHEERKEEHALAGALALGRRYQFDEAHAVHVAALAGSLFDQLRALHRLDDADRRVLLAAAVLHDIGTFVGHKRHHRHSLYLISQSELPELTPRETAICANVARYHRRGGPAAHHEPFVRLPPDDRARVAKLASLLRIADALDREHLQAVRSVRARPGADRLVLELEGDGDLLLERWALRQKADLFEETFVMKVDAGDD